jgi:hypothetical protein
MDDKQLARELVDKKLAYIRESVLRADIANVVWQAIDLGRELGRAEIIEQLEAILRDAK